MRTSLAIIAAAVVGVAVNADPAPPTWPEDYTVEGIFKLPHASGLEEPFVSYESGKNKAQRLEWFPRRGENGDSPLDTYIYDEGNRVQYQVNPVDRDWRVCHFISGDISVTPMLPDTSGMRFSGTGREDGRDVNIFVSESRTENLTSTYTLRVTADGTPVSYVMDGYNNLLGSHFDHYIVNYTRFDVGDIDPARFHKPEGLNCTEFVADDVGPSVYAGDSADDLVERARAAVRPTAADRHPSTGCDGAPASACARLHAFEGLHGRQYGSPADRAAAAARLDRAAAIVSSLNRDAAAEGRSARFAVNHLSDLSEAAAAQYRGGLHRPSRRSVDWSSLQGALKVHTAPSAEKLAGLPTEVDWSAKGAVVHERDQASCGSCWSFGAAGTVEGQIFMKDGHLEEVSEQAFMDCSWNKGNNACDGGLDFLGFEWAMQDANGAIPSWASYGGYLGQDGRCHHDDPEVKTAAILKGYVNVTSGDEAALMDAVANVGPISVSIDATPDSFYYYSSGVYDDPVCKGGVDDLDHTVLLVGYGTTSDGQDYWKIRNSWSTLWGEDGYVRIARKGNICGVATTPVYAVLA